MRRNEYTPDDMAVALVVILSVVGFALYGVVAAVRDLAAAIFG